MDFAPNAGVHQHPSKSARHSSKARKTRCETLLMVMVFCWASPFWLQHQGFDQFWGFVHQKKWCLPPLNVDFTWFNHQILDFYRWYGDTLWYSTKAEIWRIQEDNQQREKCPNSQVRFSHCLMLGLTHWWYDQPWDFPMGAGHQPGEDIHGSKVGTRESQKWWSGGWSVDRPGDVFFLVLDRQRPSDHMLLRFENRVHWKPNDLIMFSSSL